MLERGGELAADGSAPDSRGIHPDPPGKFYTSLPHSNSYRICRAPQPLRREMRYRLLPAGPGRGGASLKADKMSLSAARPKCLSSGKTTQARKSRLNEAPSQEAMSPPQISAHQRKGVSSPGRGQPPKTRSSSAISCKSRTLLGVVLIRHDLWSALAVRLTGDCKRRKTVRPSRGDSFTQLAHPLLCMRRT
jgi:hypothetical protein